MKLRYVGTVPTTFITGSVGSVEPGDEFTVPDELASAFLARADVEEVVEELPAEKPVTPKQPRVEDPEPVVTAGDEGPRE